MAVLLTLNLSCAQPGERHHLNLTTARLFLTLVEIVAAIAFLGVLDGVWDRFLQQPLLLLQMPMPKLSASCAAKFARLLQLALLRQRSAGGPVPAEFLTLVTTSDNTNSDAATNGQRCIRADTGLQQKVPLGASYSISDAARHPSQGGCWASSE